MAKLLTVKEAADATGLKASYLNSLRTAGRSGGPPFNKAPARNGAPSIRGRITYDRAELLSWNKERLAGAKVAAKAAVDRAKAKAKHQRKPAAASANVQAAV